MSEHAINTEKPLVDVRDMLVVHTAMLREFRLAPAAVRRTEPGHRRRAQAVTAHVRLLCELLLHHHEGEDELLWPKLKARTQTPVIDEAEAQHLGLDSALGAVGAALDAWSSAPTAGHREQLAAELAHLHTLLEEHLDLEERLLLPLAAAHLTPAEWAAIGEHGAASTPKPALMLVFGMFAYEGEPAVLHDMLATAPPPVRFLVPRIAPRVYARRARAIHGTSTP